MSYKKKAYQGMNLLMVQIPLKNWTSWSQSTLIVWVHSKRQTTRRTTIRTTHL